jgi:hypothetical protein
MRRGAVEWCKANAYQIAEAIGLPLRSAQKL